MFATRIPVETLPRGIVRLVPKYGLPCIIYTKDLRMMSSALAISAEKPEWTGAELLHYIRQKTGAPASNFKIDYWRTPAFADLKTVKDSDDTVHLRPCGMLVCTEIGLNSKPMVVHLNSPMTAPCFYPWIVVPRLEGDIHTVLSDWFDRFCREDRNLRILETHMEEMYQVPNTLHVTIAHRVRYQWYHSAKWPRAFGMALDSWFPEDQWDALQSWRIFEVHAVDDRTAEVRTIAGDADAGIPGETMSWIAATWLRDGNFLRAHPRSSYAYPLTYDIEGAMTYFAYLASDFATPPPKELFYKAEGESLLRVDYRAFGSLLNEHEKLVVQAPARCVPRDRKDLPYAEMIGGAGFEIVANVQAPSKDTFAKRKYRCTYSIRWLTDAQPLRSGQILQCSPRMDARKAILENIRLDMETSLIVTSDKHYATWMTMSTEDERTNFLTIRRPGEIRKMTTLPAAKRLIVDMSVRQATAFVEKFRADLAGDQFAAIWWINPDQPRLHAAKLVPVVNAFRWSPSTSWPIWKRLICAMDVPHGKAFTVACPLTEDEQIAYSTILETLSSMVPSEAARKEPYNGFNRRAYQHVLEGLLSICTGGRLPTHLRTLRGIAPVPAEEVANMEHRECSICLEEFENPLRTECAHVFCESCIERWVQAGHRCPYCRTSFEIQEDPRREYLPCHPQRRYPMTLLVNTLRELDGCPRSRVDHVFGHLLEDSQERRPDDRRHTLVLYNDPHAWKSLETIPDVDRPVLQYRGEIMDLETAPAASIVFASYATLTTLLDKIGAGAFAAIFLADPHPARMREVIDGMQRLTFFAGTPTLKFHAAEETVIENVVYRYLREAHNRPEPVLERFSTLMRTVYPAWDGGF